jgi:Arc/MetJ-type ribon-helix-helix transcriptional regulator
MSFFTIKLQVRVTDNTKKMIEDLVKSNAEKYGDTSDVIRIAILQLYRREKPNSKIRQEFKVKNMRG